MKPVAIFRHAPTEGPGFFADFLDQHSIPWQLIRIDAGDRLPDSPSSFSGLVFMGGPMSVNDDLPWIDPVLVLIREAVKVDIAVLGHCLGGQLMSKALGGVISKNPVKEIGWGDLVIANSVEAKRWFGDISVFLGFHWHGETFSIPQGASGILSSQFCENQAFTLGKHLGFQCHIEMTEPMIQEWCAIGASEIAMASPSPGVQSPELIFDGAAEKVKALNKLAEAVYARWVQNLSPN